MFLVLPMLNLLKEKVSTTQLLYRIHCSKVDKLRYHCFFSAFCLIFLRVVCIQLRNVVDKISLQVVSKRTNQPGISTTDRGFGRGRGRGRGRGFHSPGYFPGYRPRIRGRGMYRYTSYIISKTCIKYFTMFLNLTFSFVDQDEGDGIHIKLASKTNKFWMV